MLIFSNFAKVTVSLASEKFKTWGRLNHRSPLLSMPPAKTHILRPGVRPQPKRRIFVVTSSVCAASSRTRRKPWPRVPRRRWDPRSCSAPSRQGWEREERDLVVHRCAPRPPSSSARGGGPLDARWVDGEGGGAGEACRLPSPDDAGEGRGESHRRGQRTGAVVGQVAAPAAPAPDPHRPPSLSPGPIPRRWARPPSLPLPEAVAPDLAVLTPVPSPCCRPSRPPPLTSIAFPSSCADSFRCSRHAVLLTASPPGAVQLKPLLDHPAGRRRSGRPAGRSTTSTWERVLGEKRNKGERLGDEKWKYVLVGPTTSTCTVEYEAYEVIRLCGIWGTAKIGDALWAPSTSLPKLWYSYLCKYVTRKKNVITTKPIKNIQIW